MKEQPKNRTSDSNGDQSSSLISLSSSIAFFFLLSLILHILMLFLARYVSDHPKSPDPSKIIQSKNIEFSLIKNPDNNQAPANPPRFFSQNDSRASGKLTEKIGQNMIPFKPSEGGKPAAKREKQSQREGDDPQTKPSEEVTEPEAKPHIPEYFEFNKEEALNLSSEGRISFDTKKFKNSEYFLKMMDKISGYWNNALPRMANYLGLIPSGDIEMLLMLDRDGNLLDYKIVKHFDYSSMINATIYAVTHATPFGKIPDDISGPTIIIPVTFKYISTR